MATQNTTPETSVSFGTGSFDAATIRNYGSAAKLAEAMKDNYAFSTLNETGMKEAATKMYDEAMALAPKSDSKADAPKETTSGNAKK